MPARKRTEAATVHNRRRGDETAAARLVAHDWVVIAPEVVAELPDDLNQRVDDVAWRGQLSPP